MSKYKWYSRNSNVIIKYENNKIIVDNRSDIEEKIFAFNVMFFNNQYVNVEYSARTLKGAGSILSLVNRKRERFIDFIQGSKSSSIHKIKGLLLPVIIIKAKSTIQIDNVFIEKSSKAKYNFTEFLGKKSILLITPSYPSPDNLYACGFVHTRVKSYIDQGLDVEVAVINDYNVSTFYEFENVRVYKTDYSKMKDILMAKSYNAILLHFIDSKNLKYLDTSYLNETPVFIWNHGADILYKDYKEFYTQYFKDDFILPKHLKEEYLKRDKYVKKFITNTNVHWIFVSEWEKKRAEELIENKFNNSIVIHNYIDSNIFRYNKKNEKDRKKIFFVRKFDNTKKYAIDIAVLTILELSKRSFFKDLAFYICGEGNYFEQLINPIKDFDNVIINNNFLSQKQLSEYHKKSGIGLFPTRHDTQGVSALEASSSGLAVISSDIPVLEEFFDKKLGTLIETENYKKYADKIEQLYYDPKLFLKISKEGSAFTRKVCSFENTIKKEIDYIQNNQLKIENYQKTNIIVSDKPLLSIIIPSYNAEKVLQKCMLSIIKSKFLGLLEILIINDGSTDSTKKIGESFEKLYTKHKRKIIKVINKENGGHGSGINKGIELAKGKFFRVIDADDWIDTSEFDKYIEKLKNEESDEILTDYCEARTFEDKLVPKETFEFMKEYKRYNINDICSGENGFKVWGPSLPTATYKTELLKKTNFKLPEKTFYVDMLYNAYSMINIETVKKYPQNIYRYYIGNVGQSVSEDGMKKNCLHHEKIILLIMDLITNDKRITKEKKEYMINLLLLPMVGVQYYVYLDLLHSRKRFCEFEKKIKKYKNLTNYHEFNTRRIKIYRLTRGLLIPLHPLLHKLADKLRKVIG